MLQKSQLSQRLLFINPIPSKSLDAFKNVNVDILMASVSLTLGWGKR